MSLTHLEVILKTASRCNINCLYCYYFYGADKSWEKKPKRISQTLVDDSILFLKNAIKTTGIEHIQIDFHGGEPLLQGKSQFALTCEKLINELNPLCNLNLVLQTNAILIDEEWIDLFEKYHVSPSVSLDGPQTINDISRLDHSGKGTHDRVVKGIRLLQKAVEQQRIAPFGLLCVINPSVSGRTVYRYFADKLNIKFFDFLLPNYDYDSLSKANIENVGHYLLEAFDEWIQDDNPDITIRLFRSFFSKLKGQDSCLFPTNFDARQSIAMTIDTDGALVGDDSLRVNMAWHHYPEMNIHSTSFSEFLNNESQWHQQNIFLPDGCKKCLWENICGGGEFENRYSSQNGYNNPSIYCETLKKIYLKLTSFLIENGVSIDKITQSLEQDCVS